MQIFKYKNKPRAGQAVQSGNHRQIIALGAESNGNFSFFTNGKIYFSEDFGDLQDKDNFAKYKKSLSALIRDNDLQPEIILSDLHPDYVTTRLGKQLVKKYGAHQHIQIQHHIAHIFSAVGDCIINTGTCPVKRDSVFYGVACDGTGLGLDGKIWGGEVFNLQTKNYKLKTTRVGHLENQILLGGELAIQEPARMLISILSKFLAKEEVYTQVKKYYSKPQFEVLYNQLQQNFNCIETSSTGRILDAISLLLGFCGNKRDYKHAPIEMLEKNSTKPYVNIKPEIKKYYKLKTTNYELLTTPLFEYLLENINKDKKRLAATAQMYIAKGLCELTLKAKKELSSGKAKTDQELSSFFAGGVANNKIISTYLESKGVYTNKKIPRGDAGLSFGQIIFHLTNPRN